MEEMSYFDEELEFRPDLIQNDDGLLERIMRPVKRELSDEELLHNYIYSLSRKQMQLIVNIPQCEYADKSPKDQLAFFKQYIEAHSNVENKTGDERIVNKDNSAEIIKKETEMIQRLIFLEDLQSIPNPQPEVLELIKKYENLTQSKQ